MKPFLELVTEDLYRRSDTTISDLCIIFPSRRSRLYFNKHLSSLINEPTWSPAYTTISDFFREQSGIQIGNEIQLVFELYRKYKQIRQTTETFDQFYFWGNMLLSDFDDIDKYLADASMLFSNIKDIKDIEKNLDYLTEEQIAAIQQYWSVFNTEKLDIHKEFFISIWQTLYPIYTAYRNDLQKNGIGYDGMAYRVVAEKIRSKSQLNLPYKKYVFVGFNALNRCEEVLFQHLQDSGKALFYWDYDTSYITNTDHEAGYFMRTNLLRFPSALSPDHFDNLTSGNKSYYSYAIPSHTGQAKIVPGIIKKERLSDPDKIEKTSIILADEHLLLSVLHSLPDSISDINITMGYPIRSTPVAGLIELLSELRRNVRHQETNTSYYHRNVVAILNHPMVRRASPDDSSRIQQDIIRQNRFYISGDELSTNPLFSLVFSFPKSTNELAEQLMNICRMVLKNLSGPDENQQLDIERETIYTLYTEISKLNDSIRSLDEPVSTDTFNKLISQVIRRLMVPFEGEPLKGMQVMGLLETRALDFENVILLSLNEGIFPKANPPMSFIPYHLRKGYDLPTMEHQDAIFSYYFYRILQRAQNIHLAYNSSNEKRSNTQEMSRYLLQLKYEMTEKLCESYQTFEIISPDVRSITIHKTPGIVSILDQFCDAGTRKVSPSAVQKYLSCPLRFYYAYIAGIEEPDEVAEDIDDALFGNILHKALEILYSPYVNSEVTKAEIQTNLMKAATIDDAVRKGFNLVYFKTKEEKPLSLHGRNIIIHRVLKNYIRKLLETDTSFAPFRIVALEKEIRYDMEIESGGTKRMLHMYGKIDRIDELKDGRIRILDYKTGSVRKEPASIAALFDPSSEKKNYHVMQSIMYTMMYDNPKAVPGIYYIRSLYGEFSWNINIGGKPINDFLLTGAEFRTQLKSAISPLFDTSIPFTQTDDKDQCQICSFANICQKG